MTDQNDRGVAEFERLKELALSEGILTDSISAEVQQVLASVEVDSIFLEESSSADILKLEEVIEDSTLDNTESANPSDSGRPEDLRQVLLNASLPQKIKLALLGNATCRALLIRDSNRMIQQFVLKNPRLQPAEVEEFAKNPNLSAVVLKTIASNSQWMKSYSLKYIVVSNPKMPQDVSIKWVKFLNSADLKKLAKSKNVPNVVSITARKRLADTEKS